MNITKIMIALCFLIFSLTGCKKDNITGNQGGITVNTDGSVDFSDADGVLYAIQARSYQNYNSPVYSASQAANAWFGNSTDNTDAGIVKANSKVLNNNSNFYSATVFLNTGDTIFTGGSSSIVWNVQGSTATGVPAFIHTDTSTFSAGPDFTLPASININNSLTVNHSATTGNIGVIYTLSGSRGDTTKFIANGSSSITFSSNEIKAISISNDYIELSVTAVNYTTASYNGKKYYFVKQQQYTRESITQ